jgi:hypothetical protein
MDCTRKEWLPAALSSLGHRPRPAAPAGSHSAASPFALHADPKITRASLTLCTAGHDKNRLVARRGWLATVGRPPRRTADLSGPGCPLAASRTAPTRRLATGADPEADGNHPRHARTLARQRWVPSPNASRLPSPESGHLTSLTDRGDRLAASASSGESTAQISVTFLAGCSVGDPAWCPPPPRPTVEPLRTTARRHPPATGGLS